METLFTAFLSPGMNTSMHQQSCFKIPCQSWAGKTDINTALFCKEMGNKQPIKSLPRSCGTVLESTGCQDFTMQQEDIIFQPSTSMTFIMCSSTITLPFMAYFQHQIYHMSVQNRFAFPFYYSENCCFQLGYMMSEKQDCSVTSQPCCCTIQTLPTLSDICSCEIKSSGEEDQFCKLHNLVFRSMEATDKSCSWIISFLDSDSDDEDVGFRNPCYEILSDDKLHVLSESVISDDDVEIQIDMDPSSYQCIDEDTESIIYETDDDDDDDVCFQTFDFKLEFSSDFICENSLNVSCIDLAVNSTLQKSTADNIVNDSVSERKISKYHTGCVVHVNNNSENVEKHVDGKKKVHFCEEVRTHCLHSWSFAYKQSRESKWQKFANDRAHFWGRIKTIEKVLEPVLRQKLQLMNSPT